jgi:hypothetical protein
MDEVERPMYWTPEMPILVEQRSEMPSAALSKANSDALCVSAVFNHYVSVRLMPATKTRAPRLPFVCGFKIGYLVAPGAPQ